MKLLKKIKNNKSVIFNNADIYPNSFDEIRVVSYCKTTKNLTIKDRIKPNDGNYGFNRFAIKTVSGSSLGKWLRKDVANPIYYKSNPVEWRNYEATYDIKELEPSSRKSSTFVLQEYFVPVEDFKSFYPQMIKEKNLKMEKPYSSIMQVFLKMERFLIPAIQKLLKPLEHLMNYVLCKKIIQKSNIILAKETILYLGFVKQ